jgi:hypothetical protein
MAGTVFQLRNSRVFECAAEGLPLGSERDAADLLSAAWSENANFVAIPAGRLGDAFFDLKEQVAGNFVQKFVNYGMPLAIVGDITKHSERSRALTDFVKECNQGVQIWFVKDREEFARRLSEE